MRVGIETGGTKVVCALGSGPDDLIATKTLPTTTPSETFARIIGFVDDHCDANSPVESVGIASFGPIDLQVDSPTFGTIQDSPKVDWVGTDVVSPFRQHYGVPVAIDTDVNGAALGEHRWGAGRGTESSAYLTIGTGVGGGATLSGRPLHGRSHPEMGHLAVRRHPDDDHPGSCPLHGDCLEGLTSGPALRERFGHPAEALPPADLARAHELAGFYIAQLVATVTLVLSPERIILGGGVMNLDGLHDEVRARTLPMLRGIMTSPEGIPPLQNYVVAPQLGSLSGALGALALADAAGHDRQGTSG
jgi:fructokinase